MLLLWRIRQYQKNIATGLQIRRGAETAAFTHACQTCLTMTNIKKIEDTAKGNEKRGHREEKEESKAIVEKLD